MQKSIVPPILGISRETPIIWMSSCLLGNAVRYDGGHKAHRGVKSLAMVFSHYPICPELEMGMAVPRPAMSWFGDRLQENESGLDHTHKIKETVSNILEEHLAPSAIILKSKSPSCGLGSAELPIGFFAEALKLKYPTVPMADENSLETLQQALAFASLIDSSKQLTDHLQSAWNSLA